MVNRAVPWADASMPLRDSTLQHMEHWQVVSRKVARIQSKSSDYVEKHGKLIKIEEEKRNKFESVLAAKSNMEATIAHLKHDLLKKGLEALNLCIEYRLFAMNTAEVQSYINQVPANIWRNDDISSFGNTNRAFLKHFNAACATNLSIKNSFARSPEVFDLLIVDEASQCDIASALPMLYRAKRAVIIGDPLQLKHITSVQAYEDDYVKERLRLSLGNQGYVKSSLYDYAFNIANLSKTESVFLDEHYRCHPDIILEFNNEVQLT